MHWIILFIFLFKGFLLAQDFVVFVVDAPQLDYRNVSALLKSVAKHPRDWSKQGDVGHAWIYVEGDLDGQRVFIEGGHSGELGILQPRYFDGIMDRIDAGHPDPITYLWTTQKDGFFQSGAGIHHPTYAAKKELSSSQFQAILKYIQEYPYADYRLTDQQCCTFVANIAALAGVTLETEMTIDIPRTLTYNKEKLPLWSDARYARFTFGSPDKLEQSLKKAVQEKKLVQIRAKLRATLPIPY